MIKYFCLSRFLSALLALLFYVSSTLARDYPIKPQPNLEFQLSSESKDSVKTKSLSNSNVMVKFAVAPIHVIKIPSYDSVLEDATITTPVSVFEHGAVNILYQEGDKLEDFVVSLPILLDDMLILR